MLLKRGCRLLQEKIKYCSPCRIVQERVLEAWLWNSPLLLPKRKWAVVHWTSTWTWYRHAQRYVQGINVISVWLWCGWQRLTLNPAYLWLRTLSAKPELNVSGDGATGPTRWFPEGKSNSVKWSFEESRTVYLFLFFLSLSFRLFLFVSLFYSLSFFHSRNLAPICYNFSADSYVFVPAVRRLWPHLSCSASVSPVF